MRAIHFCSVCVWDSEWERECAVMHAEVGRRCHLDLAKLVALQLNKGFAVKDTCCWATAFYDTHKKIIDPPPTTPHISLKENWGCFADISFSIIFTALRHHAAWCCEGAVSEGQRKRRGSASDRSNNSSSSGCSRRRNGCGATVQWGGDAAESGGGRGEGAQGRARSGEEAAPGDSGPWEEEKGGAQVYGASGDDGGAGVSRRLGTHCQGPYLVEVCRNDLISPLFISFAGALELYQIFCFYEQIYSPTLQYLLSKSFIPTPVWIIHLLILETQVISLILYLNS